MDDKLKLLLEKINLNEENYTEFEDGKILKIISSKDKLNWNFVIETKDFLSIKVLKILDENLKPAFSNLKSATYTIKPINSSNSKINDYYSYVMESIGLSSAMLSLFKDNGIRSTTDGLVVPAENKAQENIIKNNIDNINKKFNQIGFNVNLKCVLSEDKRYNQN